METASYITGFVDGEGSFLVSFSQRSRFRIGIEVRPSFCVSQHERNEEILAVLEDFFGCGSIRFNRHDQTLKYEVRSLDHLVGKIIPHFDRYPLQTSKKNDFERFRTICLLMQEGRHHSETGVVEIVRLAYAMNNLGARRYTKTDLLQAVRKMKV